MWKAAKALGVPIDVVEFDYGLSFVLTAMYARENLRESFVFKGNRSRAYFADYRFSRDLDFTAVGGPGNELEQTMEIVARDAGRCRSTGPFSLLLLAGPSGASSSGQEAFVLQIQFPWHRSVRRSIKVEVAVDEPWLCGSALALLHPYGEALAADLLVYRLEEIVAEKLRTPLQAQKCGRRIVASQLYPRLLRPLVSLSAGGGCRRSSYGA